MPTPKAVLRQLHGFFDEVKVCKHLALTLGSLGLARSHLFCAVCKMVRTCT